MSIAACALLIEMNGTPQMSFQFTKAYAGYFVVALIALVLGCVVWILIRTCARRASRE